jgi:hypothetical protein
MPIKPLSAVEAIRPAVDRTEKFMFEPIHWARWWRMAIIGLATGEFASQGGCNFGSRLGDFGKIANPGAGGSATEIPHIPGIAAVYVAALIATLVVLIVLLALVHLYIASVARFILFDAAATGRFRLREAWTRWHSHGVRYFLFNLAFAAAVISASAVLIGIPFLVIWRMGILHHLREHWGILVGLVFLVPLFMFFWLLPLAIFSLFVKDFAIPIIALEDISIPDALRKLWGMVNAAKSDFAIYVLMKIAISIMVGIALAIINLIVLGIIVIPIVIVAAVMIAASPRTFQNPIVIALCVTLAVVVVLPIILFLIGLIAAPAVYFYESFVLSFFGSRYAPLWTMMHPVITETPGGLPMPEPPPENPPFDMPPDPSPA